MLLPRNARLIAALLGATALTALPVLAQETAAPAATEVAAQEPLYSDDDLNVMTAPIALYPDSLLAQVLLASTYPLDVVKADRFLTKSADLSDKDRAKAVETQEWPDAVKALAAGFPELISRMAANIDWTEEMGDAVLLQTDDVLEAIQRLRAEAKVNGYLEDNAAMDVTSDEETGDITISSANPDVVYVPAYNPETVYTQPAPATAAVITDSTDWGDVLATGAIVFGTAMIVDNIFDDDWNDGWGNDYWHGGGYGGNGNGNHIDWDGDVNIDNSTNIGNGIGNGGIHRPGGGDDSINIGNGNGNGIGNGGIGNGNGNGIGNGGNRPNNDLVAIDRDKFANRPDRPGDLSQDQLDGLRDSGFRPDEASRDAARAKVENRKASGKPVSTLPAPVGKNDRVGTGPSAKPGLSDKVKPRPTPSKPSARPAAKPKPNVARPAAPAKPKVKKPSTRPAPAYKPSGGSRAKAASNRGHASRGGKLR